MMSSWAGAARRRVVFGFAARLGAVLVMLMLGDAGFANPLAAQSADPGPPITEIVPVRIHGHDSSWPPVLIFAALVVVGGALVVAVVFMRRAGEALRAGRHAPRR
jgi:hypothetical protein